jgi:hypothetical protein
MTAMLNKQQIVRLICKKANYWINILKKWIKNPIKETLKEVKIPQNLTLITQLNLDKSVKKCSSVD